jgi:hypothetical protein
LGSSRIDEFLQQSMDDQSLPGHAWDQLADVLAATRLPEADAQAPPVGAFA